MNGKRRETLCYSNQWLESILTAYVGVVDSKGRRKNFIRIYEDEK
jgi:hypothetical protein